MVEEWKPDKPVSKGATAYHDAVVNAPHYIKVLDALIGIAVPKIKKGETVVDFGAGTGVSALRLLDKLKVPARLLLVDNSPAWLAKAHEVLSKNKSVNFYLLDKKNGSYATLAKTIGDQKADHVISGNTVHLIDDIESTFIGVHNALKDNGFFSFESGNISSGNIPQGALMIDGTVQRVHDIAIDMIKSDPQFAEYKKDIGRKIKEEEQQRKFVFPDPRPVEFYLKALEKTGFEKEDHQFKLFNVKYEDWLAFLRVKRLQAGILPELGGNHPTNKEAEDRDQLITKATKKLFKELENKNPMADSESFTIFIGYITAKKRPSDLMPGSRLKGKNALVTGASRGIGRAIALELARNGANVVLNFNMNEKEVHDVVKRIGNSVKCLAIKADVSDFDEVASMFETIKKEFADLDILVNSAGIVIDKTFQNMEIDDWNSVIKTNLDSMYNVTHNALKILRQSGRIVNIGSIVGLRGNFGQSNYAASKAGIVGFTKSLAKELGKNGITVNVVAPGFIDTDIIRGIPDSVKGDFIKLIPLGCLGLPKDVADLVMFLVSDKAGYITGEVISIDGGMRF